MPDYLEDSDLYYEIILSKGKGYLTKRAEFLFVLIADNVIEKIKVKYRLGEEETQDCYQQGVMRLFENWKNFDEKRFNKGLPYVTEIFKRGAYDGINQIRHKKPSQKEIKLISIERSNEGKGLHNITG